VLLGSSLGAFAATGFFADGFDPRHNLELLLALAFLLGLVVGRWWALLGALAAGVWYLAQTDDPEIRGLIGTWFLLAAISIAAGVLVRRGISRLRR
jgi:hypothetical protein